MRTDFTVSLFAVVCLAGPGNAQVWSLINPNPSPGARRQLSMCSDTQRGRILLFGGSTYNLSFYSDTWEWDGTAWIQAFPTLSPTARVDAAMAFDSQRGRVVLFGGAVRSGSGWVNVGDTWEWDGTNWTQASPSFSPSARARHSMAYDSQRHRAVLFGGLDTSLYSDTWEWDGSTWAPRLSLQWPPARHGGAMAYDAQRGVTVLFGGETVNSVWLNDTWSWNGNAWTQLQTAVQPSARTRAAMVYRPDTNRCVLFGGNANDTWAANPLKACAARQFSKRIA